MEELIKYMRAMVLLQLRGIQSSTEDGLPLKAEALLAQAGFTAREIALMLDKSQAAVAKAITRARAVRRSADPTAESEDQT